MTPEPESDPKLEIAHVLTMDVVEYSTLLITEQTRIIDELKRIVWSTARFCRAEADGKLVRVPTGDGMLLVFFDDPEAPIECAMEIAAAMSTRRDGSSAVFWWRRAAGLGSESQSGGEQSPGA
jgi:hypothetical protein